MMKKEAMETAKAEQVRKADVRPKSDPKVKNWKGPIMDVAFRHNRSFELRAFNETIRWEPRGRNPVSPDRFKDGLPQELIESKYFKSHSEYFTVRTKKGGHS